MATTLSIPVLSVSGKCTVTSGSFPTLAAYLNHAPTISVAAGSGAGNINAVIQATLAITSGTPYTVNVSTGLDPFGNAAGMVHVSAILIENDSTTAGQIFTVGGGTHPVLVNDQYTVQPNGGIAFILNPNPGYTVSSGSADTLTITVAAGTAVAGKLTIFGRTA